MIRVPVNPEILRWARERASLAQEHLMAKFSKLPDWEEGKIQPTLKQMEAFARAVHVPVGYLFLAKPPEESIPIPDFRTFTRQAITRPSPDLLDTIHTCQARQIWYRDFARMTNQPELSFVGNATIETLPETAAAEMRRALGFNLAAQRECPTWTDALRLFIRQVDEAGVLIMISEVVGSNTHRRLDPAEFRGFALSDPLAPLIFVNGADMKTAQMFTLAHQLAHIWLGASALSNLSLNAVPSVVSQHEERWCNAVAAEFLVPLAALQSALQEGEQLPNALSRLARTFKVSKLVILRRLFDANWLPRKCFDTAWAQESECLQSRVQSDSQGSNFYNTMLVRVGHRFTRALVASTLEGQTLYRDAFRMLGVSRTETFNKLGRKVGDRLSP